MNYIFLDESGDLGFNLNKKKTSKFFVITLLFAENKRPIEKVVRKIHSELKKKHKRNIGVLHAVKEKPLTRQKLLKRIADKDCLIMAIYLNKSKVYTRLQDAKQVLYNFVTNILLDRIFTRKILPAKQNITLVASRRETNKFLNLNFQNYLNQQINSRHGINIKVEIKTPQEEKSLQAVDFISWAIFRKYEYGDESYYNLIKSRIIEENPLFP